MPAMAFKKRPHGLSRLARILCGVSTALSVLLFVQYEMGLLDVQRLLSRPQRGAGPTLIHGVAKGTSGYISSGDQALLASVELWDRHPSKKGASLLCRWLEGQPFEVDDHTVVLAPENRKINSLGQWPRGQPGSLLTQLPHRADASLTPEMQRRCPRATAARVSRLRNTDPVTILGCKNGDVVTPCGDGTDAVLGYPLNEATDKLSSNELIKLILAVFTGFPPLVYLIIAMYQGAPSLERRTTANQEIS